MAIQVVCSGCKKRFTVNDKFAGKKGPCPKCKTIITIPEKTEEVVVHAPEEFGPKDSKGRAVLKPISRKETKVSLILTVGIVLGSIVALVVALLLRRQEEVSTVILGLGAVLLAGPLVWCGYAFLRDSETEPFQGGELWIRVTACAAVYAALWGIVAFVVFYLFDNDPLEVIQIVFIVPVMVAIGAFAAYASLDLDFGVASLHYGFYLLVTVALRLLAGLPAVGPPGS
jgi:phage FluMu protein Com